MFGHAAPLFFIYEIVDAAEAEARLWTVGWSGNDDGLSCLGLFSRILHV